MNRTPRYLEGLLSLLFPCPPACPLCGYKFHGLGALSGRLCKRCESNVHELTAGLCRMCGRAGLGAICADCLQDPHLFFLSRAYAAYDGSVEKAIKSLKYQGDRRMFPILGDWLVEGYCRHFGNDRHMRLVPVPMHPLKEARRGFNQANELARYLGKELRLPTLQALVREQLSESQTTHTRKERISSMKDTFALQPGIHIQGEHLLLIDDVLTTGGTADACAAVLFRGGAVSVQVLTVAR